MRKIGAVTGIAAGVLALGVVASAPPASAQRVTGPEVNWNFSTWGKSRAFTRGVETLSRLLEERTGGNFKLKVNYGGALSKSRENLDGLRINAFEAAHFCNFYHPDKNPGHMVFALPFLPLGDWDVGAYVRDALYRHPALVGELERWNATSYGSTFLPQYEFLGVGKPPRSIADWNGKRVRAGGGVADAMRKVGGTPITTTATEVYTALQRGAMDAASFPFTYAHVAYKLHEISDWYTSNLSPGTADCPLVFNLSAYRDLPRQYKRLIQGLREDVNRAQIQAYISADKKNLPQLEAKLTKIVYPPAVLAEFRRVAGEPVYKEFVEKYGDRVPAQDLLDQVFAAGEVGKLLKKAGQIPSYE